MDVSLTFFPFKFPFPGHCVLSFLKNFTYLFLAVLDFHYCSGFSLVAASRGYYLVSVHGFFIVVVSLVAEHGL